MTSYHTQPVLPDLRYSWTFSVVYDHLGGISLAKAVGLIKNGVQGLGAPVSDLCLAIGPMATEVLSRDSLFGARPETDCRITPETHRPHLGLFPEGWWQTWCLVNATPPTAPGQARVLADETSFPLTTPFCLERATAR